MVRGWLKRLSRSGATEIRDVFKGIVTVTRLLPSVSRFHFAVTAVCTVLIALLPVVSSIAAAYLLEAAASVLAGGRASPKWDELTTLAVLVAVLFFARALIISISGLSSRLLSRRLDGVLRERTMRAAMSPATVRDLEDEATRLTFESARNLSPLGFTPGVAANNLAIATSARLEPIFFGIALAFLSIPIALLMFVATVVGHAEMYRLFMTQLRQSFFVKMPTYPHYYRDLSTTPEGAKDVRVFNLGAFNLNRYRELMGRELTQTWKKRKLYSWSMIAMFAICSASIATGLIYFGYRAGAGDIGFAAFIFAMSAIGVMGPRLVIEDIAVSYGAASVPAILKVEAAQIADVHGGTTAATGLPRRSIEFRDVAFRYRDDAPDVLRGFNLELRAGERTAIVGINGAGKTTLVKLLCGFYAPTTGSILIDGQPLDTLDQTAWRSQLAVLFQDFTRYEVSAFDNVRYGSVRTDDRAAVLRAAGRIGADTVVAALPEQWDTVLSTRFTGGTDLSGGQWQRVAFARALFAVEAGAQVLVLDEPTANLDVRAEAELYDQFLDLTAPRAESRPLTTVVISHRLSTVRRADRIVVIDGGNVAEDGAHDELMARGGRYAAMFNAQASRFADAEAS